MEKQIYSLQVSTIFNEFDEIVKDLTTEQFNNIDSFSVGKDVYFYYRARISYPCLPYNINYQGFEINLDKTLQKDIVKINFK